MVFSVLLRWFSPLYGPHEQIWTDLDTFRVAEFHLEILVQSLLAFDDAAAIQFVINFGFVSEICINLSCCHCVLMLLQFGCHGSEEGPSCSVWSVCCHVTDRMQLKIKTLLVLCICGVSVYLWHGARFPFFFVSQVEILLNTKSRRSLFTV